MADRRLPSQDAPVQVGDRTTACASTRTVVHRIPDWHRHARTAGLVGGGVLFALAGLVILVLGEVPGATPVDDADPAWLGGALVLVGVVMAWMGWSSRGDDGWAVAPEGVVVADRTVPWHDVGWFGLTAETVRSERWVRQVWQLSIRDDHHGLVRVSAARKPDPDRVAELSRAVAAAWLVGAPPPTVPFVVAPPEHESSPPSEDLTAAWNSIRDGRWAEIHDLGRLDGAAVLPGDLHGAGLGRLDEVVPDPHATLDRRPLRRRRRLRVRVSRGA